MIKRSQLKSRVSRALKRSRVVALIGPRQSGKTTLAREFVNINSLNYFDLEDPRSLIRLSEPMTALAPLKGLVVIDEVQRKEELFPILRVLADRKPLPARFLVLGSASPALLRQSSETLAGRIEMVVMGGLNLVELGASSLDRHWLRGAFPPSYLARSETDSLAWRKQFISTILERDFPQLGVSIPTQALYRFWAMLAHVHGNIWKASDPARSLGVSQPTVRRYLDLLSGLFMVRQLQPWYGNLSKRQVKSPKIYIRDSGVLHELLKIKTKKDLLSHPKCGASWEGYAIEQVVSLCDPDEVYFWATYQGAELDMLLLKNGKRFGVEIKRKDAPAMTPSIRIAMEDLKLRYLSVLYPGKQGYQIDDKVGVVPLSALASSPEVIYGKVPLKINLQRSPSCY